jgi:intracellular septation protein
MQVLFDFLPLVAFFIAFKLGGIYVATGVITASVALVSGYRLARGQKLTTLQILSAVLMLALGGLTLLLHDDRFILWKPTTYYWLVSGGLLGSLVMSKAPVLQQLIGAEIVLSRQRWVRLTWAWVLTFATLGGLNLFVAFNYSRDTWVNFKFVLLGISFVFFIVQGVWIALRAENLAEPADTSVPEKSSAPQ